MKSTRLFSAVLACLLLVARTLAATDIVAEWTAELRLAQQAYNQNAGSRAGADEFVRTALAGVFTGVALQGSSGRSTEAPPAGVNLDAATAQAGYSLLSVLYPGRISALDAQLADSLAKIDDVSPAIAAGREWGRHVAELALAEESDAISLNTSSFTAGTQPPVSVAPSAVITSPGRYRFSVLAGAPGLTGSADGIATTARFDRPAGLAVDAAGNAYVSEKNLHTIRKITPGGSVTTFAGVAGEKGSQDGAGPVARFNGPQGLAVDGAGNVYVADTTNGTIRKISPSGLVTTLAGTAGKFGYADGVGEAARFYSPVYVAVDGAGVVYVGEHSETGIRKITPNGMVSTLKVKVPWYYGTYIGGIPVRGLVADRAGILYAIYSDYVDVSDILKLTPTADGQYESSAPILPPISSPNHWGYALGLAVDAANNLYIKYDSDPIIRLSPAGAGEVFYAAGNTSGYVWDSLCVDGQGRMLAVPSASYSEKAGTIEVGIFDPTASGVVITQQPVDRSAEIGPGKTGYAGFTVQAAGATALTYQWYFNSSAIPGATGGSYEISNVQMRDAGNYTVVVGDGKEKITSRIAKLVVAETAPSGPGVIPPVGSAPATASSGGGSFDGGVALALLGLLAAAATRRRSGRPGISRPDVFQDKPVAKK